MRRNRRTTLWLVLAALAVSTSAQAQAVVDSSATEAALEERVFPVEARPPAPLPEQGDPLASYRTNEDYRYDARPFGPSPMERFWRWLGRKIGELLGDVRVHPYTGRVLAGLAVLLFLFFVARLGARYGAGTLYSRRAGAAEDADALPERLDTLDLDAWVREAIASGNARSIVRAVYLRALRDLSERGLIVYRAKATNAEYLRRLPPDLRAAFAPLVRRFEELWYGDYPPRPTDADDALRAEAAVQAAARRAVPDADPEVTHA